VIGVAKMRTDVGWNKNMELHIDNMGVVLVMFPWAEDEGKKIQ